MHQQHNTTQHLTNREASEPYVKHSPTVEEYSETHHQFNVALLKKVSIGSTDSVSNLIIVYCILYINIEIRLLNDDDDKKQHDC